MMVPFIIVAVILGLLLFLVRFLRSLSNPESTISVRWKRGIRLALSLLTLSAIGLAVWGFLIEPNRLIVHPETIAIDNWPQSVSGLRIAVIGDVHTGAPFINDQKLQKIVELTNQQQPDLIVLLGDYMSPNSWHSHEVLPEVTAAAFKSFKAPLGVYAVLGNHDAWYNVSKVRQAFEQNGIPVLENEVAEVKWKGGSFWLAGLADLWTRPQRIDQTLAQIPPGAAIIALTHNPDIFLRLPQRVPLLLAAHTHGGQVNLPLIGRPIEPSDYGQRYAAGHVYENGHHLFVTTGIGTSILPVRFRVTPEIVLLTVKASGSAAD
jgi:predicted MPP superfamily phosphohydrolase